ncbi:MAG TPA: hypothetical protein VFD73_02290 [Gemmatimonadales bacterium]|nr:hypothetical protein [Gemmatimonadales bacterium]
MMKGTWSPIISRGAASRLVAAATLAVFLLSQPAVICLPLCISGGHYQASMEMHRHSPLQPCHSLDAIRAPASILQISSTMLPAAGSPSIPLLPLLSLGTRSPVDLSSAPIPSLDPPPPRLI